MYVRDGVVYICSHIHIFGIVRCSYVPIDNVGKAYSECGKQETESMLKVAQAVKQHNKGAFITAFTSKQPLSSGTRGRACRSRCTAIPDTIFRWLAIPRFT